MEDELETGLAMACPCAASRTALAGGWEHPQQAWSRGLPGSHCHPSPPLPTSPSWTLLVPGEGIKLDPGELGSRAVPGSTEPQLAGTEGLAPHLQDFSVVPIQTEVLERSGISTEHPS